MGRVKRPKFLYASSEVCADLLYAARFRAPDEFAFLLGGDGAALLLSDLEIDRARKTLPGVRIDSLSEWQRKARERGCPDTAGAMAHWLKRMGVKKVDVPSHFPLGLAVALKNHGIRCRPINGECFPEREIKTADEIRHLRRSTRIACAGVARATEILEAATMARNKLLKWSGRTLTSEMLRMEMESAVVRAGGEARGDTIVACGEAGCDPHERGQGALRANELIILDIFPRDGVSGYFGDITRTVVKGKASEAQSRLWHLCLEGQRSVLKQCQPGRSGKELQETTRDFFAANGFPTGIADGRWRGFFHGLGHGLGLEVHEWPRVADTTLKAGQVLTIEPGIYWPGIGGVRHEDTIQITEKGHRLLGAFPKRLEIA